MRGVMRGVHERSHESRTPHLRSSFPVIVFSVIVYSVIVSLNQ